MIVYCDDRFYLFNTDTRFTLANVIAGNSITLIFSGVSKKALNAVRNELISIIDSDKDEVREIANKVSELVRVLFNDEFNNLCVFINHKFEVVTLMYQGDDGYQVDAHCQLSTLKIKDGLPVEHIVTSADTVTDNEGNYVNISDFIGTPCFHVLNGVVTNKDIRKLISMVVPLSESYTIVDVSSLSPIIICKNTNEVTLSDMIDIKEGGRVNKVTSIIDYLKARPMFNIKLAEASVQFKSQVEYLEYILKNTESAALLNGLQIEEEMYSDNWLAYGLYNLINEYLDDRDAKIRLYDLFSGIWD